MVPRDFLRRFLNPARPFPAALKNKWLSVGLVLVYLWAYEAFDLWQSPFLTAWLVVGYFVSALLVDSLFRGASFCKYVCPVGQFNFLGAAVSPFEVRPRSAQTCSDCKTHDCVRGNSTARGCELDLFQPTKLGNFDCTLCLDCVHACPHDNVALGSVVPASALLRERRGSSIGELAKRPDLAVFALVLSVGAFVNAAGMVSPISSLLDGLVRDFGVQWEALLLLLLLLVSTLVVPVGVLLSCAAFARSRAGQASVSGVFNRLAFSLVPLGVSMWLAHFSFHLVSAWDTAALAGERFAGDFLGLAANSPSGPFMVHLAWLESVEIFFLDVGLLSSLYVAWRICGQWARPGRSRGPLFAPIGVATTALYLFGVWILLQPMEMRGMM
jgi:ferredoxin